MKKLLAIIVVVLFTATISWAENPYNVPTNNPVNGSLTVKGNVLHQPIVIEPATQTIDLFVESGGIYPGSYEEFSDKYAIFNVTCAKGYKVGVTGNVQLVDNVDSRTSIIADYAFSFDNGVTYPTDLKGNISEGAFDESLSESETVAGAVTVKVNISKFTADPGAAVGARTFTMSIAAVYE